MSWHPSFAPRAVVGRVLRPLERFLRIEAASGIVLLAAAATALLAANSPWASRFDALWASPLTLGVGSLVSTHTVRFWIDDGLMTVFFFVVGLEIKQEWGEGVLSDRRTAVLPIAAAIGGVLAPASLYLLLNPGPELHHGWAIPTATDIAFAVGVLSLLGKRVPPALRALLLTLAIIDDVLAIIVIAWYYSAGIDPTGMLLAACGALLALALQRFVSRNPLIYVGPGVLLWLGLEHAGIHPTLAGVILGLMIPSGANAEADCATRNRQLRIARRELQEIRARLRRGERTARDLRPPLQRLKFAQREILPTGPRIEAALHPWVAYGVMPLFALANAGVALASTAPAAAHTATLLAGIVLALTLGKPLGILLAVRLSVSAGLCALPEGIAWRHLLVLGCLGGIGFTMSIFMANLAFTAPALLATAKMSVLIASILSASAGLALGRAVLKSSID